MIERTSLKLFLVVFVLCARVSIVHKVKTYCSWLRMHTQNVIRNPLSPPPPPSPPLPFPSSLPSSPLSLLLPLLSPFPPPSPPLPFPPPLLPLPLPSPPPPSAYMSRH